MGQGYLEIGASTGAMIEELKEAVPKRGEIGSGY